MGPPRRAPAAPRAAARARPDGRPARRVLRARRARAARARARPDARPGGAGVRRCPCASSSRSGPATRCRPSCSSSRSSRSPRRRSSRSSSSPASGWRRSWTSRSGAPASSASCCAAATPCTRSGRRSSSSRPAGTTRAPRPGRCSSSPSPPSSRSTSARASCASGSPRACARSCSCASRRRCGRSTPRSRRWASWRRSSPSAAPAAPLALCPLVLLLANMARERERRIASAHDRLQALERERHRLRVAVRRIGDAFASNLDLDALLQIVTRAAVEALDAGGGRASVARGARLLPRAVVQDADAMAAMLGEAERQAVERAGVVAVGPGTRWALAAPIGVGLAPAGAVAVARTDGPFGPQDRDLFAYLCEQATISAANVDRHETLHRQALTDELTGLANHRRLQDLLTPPSTHYERTGTPVSLVLLDLDDFKRVNDTHGHQTGDMVLRAVAGCLRAHCRVRRRARPLRRRGARRGARRHRAAACRPARRAAPRGRRGARPRRPGRAAAAHHRVGRRRDAARDRADQGRPDRRGRRRALRRQGERQEPCVPRGPRSGRRRRRRLRGRCRPRGRPRRRAGPRPARRASSSCTTSRRSRCPIAASWVWRRCSAGTTPRAG